MQEALDTGTQEEAEAAAVQRIQDGDIYLWATEATAYSQPVSMAMKTRPTRCGISVTLVYTPPEMRRRGYASACVAELSRMLLDEGWEYCSLYTDLANPTSNHIYAEIGYGPVCDVDEYEF